MRVEKMSENLGRVSGEEEKEGCGDEMKDRLEIGVRC